MPKPRTLHDEYFKKAKELGYVARSAFKLIEINQKRRLVRRSDTVLDLGCAPGSWLQVLDERQSARARIVGIDLAPVTAILSERAVTIIGDIYTFPPEDLLGAADLDPAAERFDAVLSDMAPNTSGHGDDFLSARLCERAMDLFPRLLAPGGNTILKILEGEPTPDVIARLRRMFTEAGTTKPAASREVSREIFLWGQGYLGLETKAR